MDTYTSYSDTDTTDLYADDLSVDAGCCGPVADTGYVEYVEPTWTDAAPYESADLTVWLDPEPAVVAPTQSYDVAVPTEAAAVMPAGQPGGWTGDGFSALAATPAPDPDPFGATWQAAVAAGGPTFAPTEMGGFSALATTTDDPIAAFGTGPAFAPTEMGGFSALATTTHDPIAAWGTGPSTVTGPAFAPTEMTIFSTPGPLGEVYAQAAARGDVGTQIAVSGIRESETWMARLGTLPSPIY